MNQNTKKLAQELTDTRLKELGFHPIPAVLRDACVEVVAEALEDAVAKRLTTWGSVLAIAQKAGLSSLGPDSKNLAGAPASPAAAATPPSSGKAK